MHVQMWLMPQKRVNNMLPALRSDRVDGADPFLLSLASEVFKFGHQLLYPVKKCRLIYKSVATPALKQPGELDRLAETASHRNEDFGITGVLALTGDQILQALEGPYRFVNRLYHSIANDPRHTDVELISFESAEGPLFTEWSIRFIDLEKLPDSVRELFLEKYAHKEAVISVPSTKLGAISLLIDIQRAGLTA